MIFSEKRGPLSGIMLIFWSMIISEIRYPLFGIMLHGLIFPWVGEKKRRLAAPFPPT
jgi:hypothetical protein